jgi:hypothetical protein
VCVSVWDMVVLNLLLCWMRCEDVEGDYIVFLWYEVLSDRVSLFFCEH